MAPVRTVTGSSITARRGKRRRTWPPMRVSPSSRSSTSGAASAASTSPLMIECDHSRMKLSAAAGGWKPYKEESREQV